MSKLKDSMMKSEDKLLERAYRLMEYKYLATKYKQDMKHRAVNGMVVGMVAQMKEVKLEGFVAVILAILIVASYTIGNITSNRYDLGYTKGYETALRDFKIKEIKQ